MRSGSEPAGNQCPSQLTVCSNQYLASNLDGNLWPSHLAVCARVSWQPVSESVGSLWPSQSDLGLGMPESLGIPRAGLGPEKVLVMTDSWTVYLRYERGGPSSVFEANVLQVSSGWIETRCEVGGRAGPDTRGRLGYEPLQVEVGGGLASDPAGYSSLRLGDTGLGPIRDIPPHLSRHSMHTTCGDGLMPEASKIALFGFEELSLLASYLLLFQCAWLDLSGLLFQSGLSSAFATRSLKKFLHSRQVWSNGLVEDPLGSFFSASNLYNNGRSAETRHPIADPGRIQHSSLYIIPSQRFDLLHPDRAAVATLWCGTRVLRPGVLPTDSVNHADYKWIRGELGGANGDENAGQGTAMPSGGSEVPPDPLRRSQRRSRVPAVPSSLPAPQHMRIVYVLGKLPRSDQHQWNQLITAFHSDESVQNTLKDIMANAQCYLQWQDLSHGLSYQAKQPIPAGTRICFFSGRITTRAAAALSNHLIGLGDQVDGHAYEVVIDGSGVSSEDLGLGQAMNHSCSPNAEVEVIETDSGLDLLAIKASRDIPAGTAVTIHYDQRASAKDKRNRLTFWEWNPPTSSKPVGRLQRIQCRCARPCPNRLWRDELGSRTP